MTALDPATLFDLLWRGVPWPVAQLAVPTPGTSAERGHVLNERLIFLVERAQHDAEIAELAHLGAAP